MLGFKRNSPSDFRPADPNPIIEARLKHLEDLEAVAQSKRSQIGDYTETVKKILATEASNVRGCYYALAKAAAEHRHRVQAALNKLEDELVKLLADIAEKREDLEQFRASYQPEPLIPTDH